MICSCRLICQLCGHDIRGHGESSFRDYRSWVHVESGVPCLHEPEYSVAGIFDEAVADYTTKAETMPTALPAVCTDRTPLTTLSFVLRTEDDSSGLRENILDLKVFVDNVKDVSLLVERLSAAECQLRVAICLNKLSDDATLDLILHHKIQSLIVKDIKEALSWVAKYLKIVSQESSGGVGVEKKPRVRKYPDLDPVRNVWVNQLELIPGISRESAIRISERWRTPAELILWLDLHTEEELSKEILANQKPVGKIPARRLFKLLSCNAQPTDRIIA